MKLAPPYYGIEGDGIRDSLSYEPAEEEIYRMAEALGCESNLYNEEPRESLRKWTIEHNIRHQALEDLLRIIKHQYRANEYYWPRLRTRAISSRTFQVEDTGINAWRFV